MTKVFDFQGTIVEVVQKPSYAGRMVFTTSVSRTDLIFDPRTRTWSFSGKRGIPNEFLTNKIEKEFSL